MKPSCGSGPGSWQNPAWRERAILGRRYETGAVGLGSWDLTCAARVLLWPGLLTRPFCWGLNPEASLSEVALSPTPGVNFSLKVALDLLQVHKTSTSDAWPLKPGGKQIQLITFSGSTVTTGSAS